MAAKKKNVIVFTSGERSYAVQLGWIREVFTFGHVTPVPLAPPCIAGVVNFRGSIVSVVDLRALGDEGGSGHAWQGESALLIEVNRSQVALRAGTIDEVSSLSAAGTEGYLIDSRGRDVELLQPDTLIARIQGPLPAQASGAGASEGPGS